MAITAVISTPEDCVAERRPVRVKLVITNSGTDAVDLVRAVARCSPGSQAAIVGQPQGFPTTQTSIAGSNGTLTMYFDVEVLANVRPNQQCTTVGIVAEVQTSGPLVAQSNVLSITAVPQTEPPIYLPKAGIGSLSLDSQNQSANFPALL